MKWILLAAMAPVFAEDWNALRKVFPAQEAIVKPLDGKRLKGSIKSVSGTALVIDTATGCYMIERGLIDWVSVKKSDSATNARKGAVIAAGSVFALSVLAWAPKEGVKLAPLTATYGAFFGLISRRHVRIYMRQRP